MSFRDFDASLRESGEALDRFRERAEKTIDSVRILGERELKQLGILVEKQVSSLSLMTETIERLETGMRAGANRQANAVNTLLGGQGFSYLFEIWLGAAVNDINDPGLGQLEITMRTWAPASKDVDFGQLRKMIRKATERARRLRGRDAKVTDDELQNILDEVTGR